MDYNNNFNENRLGRWYHEYKKFKNNLGRIKIKISYMIDNQIKI